MPGIGVILNPHSRSNKRNPDRIKEFGFIVGDRGSCHETGTLDEVKDLARQFKERQIEILGISGGDGTNHKTLTSFLEVYGNAPLPKIAILRGGTMNNLAWQLGIRGEPEKILSNLILKYHRGEEFKEKQMNMINVNGVYGFLLGMGLIDRFIRIYQNCDGGPTPTRGLLLLIKATLSAILNGRLARELCERFDAKIYVDGKLQPFKNYMMIFAGTMQTLGFRFRPLYRGASIPGQFQFVGISATPRQLFSAFPRALLALPSRSPHFTDEMGSEVIMEFAQPMSYTVDGDFAPSPADRVSIKVGPLLTFVLP
jgi:diacylglycerol kinase family enzyme